MGFFGVTTFFFAALGTILIFYGAAHAGHLEPLADLDQPAALEYGLGLRTADWRAGFGRSSRSARSAPSSAGRCARWKSAASWAWAIMCPFAFGVAIFAYVTLVVIRPVLMGAWGHAFPYGIFSHLDWVSERRLRLRQLPLQPGAHDRGHASSSRPPWRWRCTAALILSAVNPEKGKDDAQPRITKTPIFRDLIGYSIGTLGHPPSGSACWR